MLAIHAILAISGGWPYSAIAQWTPNIFKIKRVWSKVLMQSYIHYHFCEFSTVFHQIRWDVNKLFPLHSYLNEVRLKLFERSKILKWTPRHEFVGLVFDAGSGDLGMVLNVLVAHRSACIHSYNICRSMVTSCPQIIYPCHKTFIPSFSYANSIKKNIIFLRENGDGPNLYNSIWNKMLKNKNHKIKQSKTNL